MSNHNSGVSILNLVWIFFCLLHPDNKNKSSVSSWTTSADAAYTQRVFSSQHHCCSENKHDFCKVEPVSITAYKQHRPASQGGGFFPVFPPERPLLGQGTGAATLLLQIRIFTVKEDWRGRAFSSVRTKWPKSVFSYEGGWYSGWGKMVVAPTFYLQRVSTADWASPLVLVAAPPP